MAKPSRKKAKRNPVEILGPTEEQTNHYDYERALLAYKRVCIIDKLKEQGVLSERQHKGLARYRDVAIAEDRSPMRDSLDKAAEGFMGGGGGLGLPPSLLRLAIELGRLERDLGPLLHIARAIAVDDMSLSQWAMHQSGSVMRQREMRSKLVTVFEPTRKAKEIATLEIRMAGEWLAAAIGA